MLVTLKAGNGSVNSPKAFGAPDRKGCLWALLAGCSLSYSDLPLEIYTCFTSDWMLQCMCIYFILCEHPSPKLCRMTNLGRRTSLHVCSGLQLLSGWKGCVDFDPRTVSVLWNYEGRLYQNSTEMKCYMPGDIQRNKKVRDIQWKTFQHLQQHWKIFREQEGYMSTCYLLSILRILSWALNMWVRIACLLASCGSERTLRKKPIYINSEIESKLRLHWDPEGQ